MTKLTVERLKELREYAKQCIIRDVTRTIDNVFDIVESTCDPPKKMPPNLWPLAGFDEVFGSVSGNLLDDDCSPLKKPFDFKQSIFDLSIDDDGTNSASSGAALSIYNSDKLKKIFEQVLPDDVLPEESSSGPGSSSGQTNGGSSDCESDHNQNCARDNCGTSADSRYSDSSFAASDIIKQINDMPPLKPSLADSKISLAESHFVVPPAVWSPLGPITPPKKSSDVSFAKVAAASASKSPTKTAKTGDMPLLTVVKKSDTKNFVLCKNVSVGVGVSGSGFGGGHPPPQKIEYNHQFWTRQVKCFVGKCQESFANVPMLNEHLKRKHGMFRHLCPLADRCEQTFEEPSEISQHIETCHPNQIEWVCKKCSDKPTFLNSHLLGKHHYFYHQEGIFMCKEERCNISTKNRGEMITHCKEKHGQGSIAAEQYYHLLSYSSLSKYQNVNYRLKHGLLATGTDDKRFLTLHIDCLVSHCPSRLLNQNELEDHLGKVHGKFPFLCPISLCSESFQNSNQLKAHMFKMHSRQNGSIYYLHCDAPHCNYFAREHLHLSSHIYWHHREGLFKCTKCAKTGKYRNDITSHYSAVHQ